MSNPIYDYMGRPQMPVNPPYTPGGNIMQKLKDFASTIQGNPESIVKGLMNSGRMSQQQFQQFGQMADQILHKK